MLNMSIGERISELRTKRKLSQYQLAKALEVSRQAVSKWENDTAEPDTLNLIHLADVLDSDIEYLATGKTTQKPISPTVVTVEKIIERPVEVIKIVEKPVEIEKLVYVDRIQEKVVEKPIIRKVVRTKLVRNPIEYIAMLIFGAIIGLIIGVSI